MNITKVLNTDRWAFLIMVATIIGSAVAIYLVATMPLGDESTFQKRRALCDRAVEALLNSTELVEVTRAGIVIRRLDCSIGRRLP